MTVDMAPRKGASPFSRVKSAHLDPNKYWYVLSKKICGESPPKYFCQKFPARFSEEIVKIKRQDLKNEDGGPYKRKASSEDEIVASSLGIVAVFLRHSADSPIFKEEAFRALRNSLNGLDLSILCGDRSRVKATGTDHEAASSAPFQRATTNRRLFSTPSPTLAPPSHQVVKDTGCSLLTPPTRFAN